MLDVELRRLRKAELLELLLEIEEENEQLAGENRQLKEQLANKKVSLESVGSIAEASLQLSGVIAAAQEAADIYLYNVRDLANQQEQAQIEVWNKTAALCLDYARKVERQCAEAAGQAAPYSLEAQVRALFEQASGTSEPSTTNEPTTASAPSTTDDPATPNQPLTTHEPASPGQATTTDGDHL